MKLRFVFFECNTSFEWNCTKKKCIIKIVIREGYFEKILWILNKLNNNWEKKNDKLYDNERNKKFK